jgi:hypothetical protein
MNVWQFQINRYNKLMRYVLLLTLILIPKIALSSPAEEPPDNRIPILESAQELFGTRANFAANRLDSFFATERADDEFGRTRLRIRSRYDIRERARGDQSNQYRINLRLPHLEEKFKYDYYQDHADDPNAKKKKKKSSEFLTPSEKRERARLRDMNELEVLKKDTLFTGWIFNSDIGVNASIPPKLITRARVRKSFVTGTLINRFVEQLTYITDESGLLEETQINSDHIYNQDLIFRFINSKTWRVLQKEFRTNHGPTFLQRVTEDDAFNYGVTMQTVIDNSTWYVDNYRASINYRRNLYKQWAYFDIIPGIDFPKIWSFRRTPFITFQIELLFGS